MAEISDKEKREYAKECKRRLDAARAQKALVVKDLQEALFFTKPRLSRVVTSTMLTAKQTADDFDDLATGLGSEVSEDFATEMISAFFPPHTPWASSSAELLPEGAEIANVAEDVKAYDKGVFSAIRRSNFDAELGVALDPDAAVGTIALDIKARGGGRPYKVEHVPLRELEINLGPDGEVDDRFRVRWIKLQDLKGVVGDIDIPAKVEQKIAAKRKEAVECAWGWWRDWTKPQEDRFVHSVTIDGEVAHYDDGLDGTGSVPLIVMPFAPDRVHAFGCGPAIKALPEYRVLDVFTEATQDGAAFSVKKPFGYPDDGVIDFEGGIEAGKAYPLRPGSGKDVVPLVFPQGQNEGYVTIDRLERSIRRKHFADYPEQDGKTPPTATQWVDEMLRAQRRIGTPGMNFWRVGPKAVFERFAWLCEKDSLVKPVLADGKAVPLTPQNPATQAQDHQRLQVGLKLLEIGKGYFPMTSQAAIDEMATLEKIQKLLRDDLIVFRSSEEVKGLIAGVLGAAAQGQGQGGAPQGQPQAGAPR